MKENYTPHWQRTKIKQCLPRLMQPICESIWCWKQRKKRGGTVCFTCPTHARNRFKNSSEIFCLKPYSSVQSITKVKLRELIAVLQNGNTWQIGTFIINSVLYCEFTDWLRNQETWQFEVSLWDWCKYLTGSKYVQISPTATHLTQFWLPPLCKLWPWYILCVTFKKNLIASSLWSTNHATWTTF